MRADQPLSPADLEVVTAIRAVHDHGRPVVVDTTALIEQGRVMRRRRMIKTGIRAGAGGVVLAAAAVAALLVIPSNATAPSIGGAETARSTPSAQAPATAAATPTGAASVTTDRPATSQAATSRSPQVDSQAKVSILTSVFGADYTVQPQQRYSRNGALNLTPGSGSAAGLPTKYSAGVVLSLLEETSTTGPGGGTAPTIQLFCEPSVEKGTTKTGCVPQTQNGLTVQITSTDAPNTTDGTNAGLEVLYSRPDGQVQIAALGVYTTTQATTQERAAAATWLNAQLDRLITAATSPNT